jgi:diphosphomevalonate decarboxylase
MISENNFISTSYSFTVEFGQTSWEAPSNIALVKYWGKKENQIPANPSVSLTLSQSKTITEVSFSKKDNSNGFSFDFLFEDKPKEDFKPKIEQFFKRVEKYLPFLSSYHFVINSRNTFPHSSGIASSASAMAALSLCLMSIERQFTEISDDFFYKKASFLARLGSGSACRSVKGNPVVWGAHKEVNESSDLFGVELPEIHEIFRNYQDTILLVDVGAKEVSSSVGHNLMHNHPYANRRFDQAHENLSAMLSVFQSGDLNKFIEITESEALTLHSMMMTSSPYFILMKPNTLHIINRIWEYRKQTGVPVCFTLDAGANVHVLYPESYKNQVLEFIKNSLVEFCHNGQFIEDQTGNGAVKRF